MLMHWGAELFCFWAIILSARAIVLFLSDGFVRYIVNRYNLLFHVDESAAAKILASGISFLIVFSAGLCLLISILFLLFPALNSFVFATENQLFGYLPFCLVSYIIAASVQNVQRMYAGTKEVRGWIWHNMVFEVVLLLLEILLLAFILKADATFSSAVFADSSLIVMVALFYLLHLSVKYPLKGLMHRANIAEGAKDFAKATQLYASNFFEKLSTDGLVLFLSFFRFDKAAIALFATVRTIVNTPLLAQNLLLNTYTPEMQKHFSLRDTEAFGKLLNFIRLRVAPVLCLGIVLLLPIYEPVFNYWTKGEIVYNDTFMIIMLIMAVFNLYGLSYSFVLKGVNALPQMFVVMLAKSLLLLMGFVWANQNIIAFGWVLLSIEFLSSLVFLPLISYNYWRKEGLPLKAKNAWLGLIPYFLTAIILSLYFVFAHSLDSLNI